jgi:hypothetical protein
MVPTRGRPEKCARILKSFVETTSLDTTDILFITDGDDDSYENMDWGVADHAVIDPRESLTGKLNRTADICAEQYNVLMFVGDDHVFVTPGWDDIMLRELDSMGGTGMLYPDDKRRVDVPEIIMISSDIVKTLGHFAEPSLKHYYLDNSWAEIGKRTGLIKFCPDVVIEHHHYSVDDTVERDKTYVEAENAWGSSDLVVYHEWRAGRMPVQVSQLRRKFNPDIQWVIGRADK